MSTTTLLRAAGVVRRYGGVTAVDHVSIELVRGSVHALIGTNGAGKSTLVGVLSGELRADAGTIELDGVDVTRWTQPSRALAGLGRTYQRSTLFPTFSVLENCRLCAQARHPQPWRLGAAARDPRTLDDAWHALAQTGLTSVAAHIAGTLSHGQQRQLEVAMCITTRPAVLLLDEPLAGMGAAESAAMLDLLAALRESHAILLVEHDMDAVFRVADRISVMVDGAVIASGAPAAVRADAAVQSAYLGNAFDDDAPPAAADAAGSADPHGTREGSGT